MFNDISIIYTKSNAILRIGAGLGRGTPLAPLAPPPLPPLPWCHRRSATACTTSSPTTGECGKSMTLYMIIIR